MIAVTEKRRGSGLVTSVEAIAVCDQPGCVWRGEKRSMKALAERDMAIHMEDHYKSGGLF